MSKRRNRRVSSTSSIIPFFSPENNNDSYFTEGFTSKSFKTSFFNLYYNKNILEYRKFFLHIENKFKL